jgi:hypothetical protein
MKIAINDLILIFFGETIAEYCFTHKLENMVNIIHKRCVHENCDKHSSFNHFKTFAEYFFPINWKIWLMLYLNDAFMKIVISVLL